MSISSTQVRDLREKTGAGMMDCKKALEESGGDMEAAIDSLRKKGLAKAQKRAGKAAAEGLSIVYSAEKGVRVAALEVNCETDFVARNDEFRALTQDLGILVCMAETQSAELLMTKPFPTKNLKASGTVQEVLSGLVGKIGENIVFRRACSYHAKGQEVIGNYVHGDGRVSVLVRTQFKSAQVGRSDEGQQFLKEICMHIAAMKPEFVNSSQIDSTRMEREKAIYLQQALDTGKPREIAEKMVMGKLKKFYEESCLLDQLFVKDPNLSVDKYIQQFNKSHNETVSVKEFVRFALGEGVEKTQEE